MLNTHFCVSFIQGKICVIILLCFYKRFKWTVECLFLNNRFTNQKLNICIFTDKHIYVHLLLIFKLYNWKFNLNKSSILICILMYWIGFRIALVDFVLVLWLDSKYSSSVIRMRGRQSETPSKQKKGWSWKCLTMNSLNGCVGIPIMWDYSDKKNLDAEMIIHSQCM